MTIHKKIKQKILFFVIYSNNAFASNVGDKIITGIILTLVVLSYS